MFGALDIYLGACQYYIGIYPNIEDNAEILKDEQKIIGSEKTEMIHQNKKECSCALALLQERTYLLRTY